jgi:3-oxoacyl-(acyl-carrier-protein) synthase
MKKISISYLDTISSLGRSPQVWSNYKRTFPKFEGIEDLGAIGISSDVEKEFKSFLKNRSDLKKLDRSVCFLIFQAQQFKSVDIEHLETGLNVASSRGATSLFEKYLKEFLESSNSSTAVLSSPTTTLGNLSSFLAHEIGLSGFEMSHSITCSSALHALVNGVTWLESGRADQFVVGASEAANTPFTISQMRALKVYSKELEADLPIRSMDFDKKKNTMVLGEGSGLMLLKRGEQSDARAYINGLGFASEAVEHPAALSARADCFQKSMKKALLDYGETSVDAVVMHAPGTVLGDCSEFNAIADVFGDALPAMTSNKWMVGHTLGVSGLLSLEMGVLMLENQEFVPNPFYSCHAPKEINSVMINAVGFGGNAVSVILTKA